MRTALRWLCAGLCLISSATALGHSGDATGFASVAVDGSKISYRLTPTAPTTDEGMLSELMKKHISVNADGVVCTPASPHALQLDFACPTAPQQLTIRDDLPEALGDKHHIVAVLTWSGGSQSLNFSNTERVAQITLNNTGQAKPHYAGGFFILGIEHIVTGYDHLLFLLALVLCGGGLLSLLKIITAFTVAHSLTLGAAALSLITPPAAAVEAVIALSIAYVAFENLFPRFAISRRWTVSFLFGLVHGFGFSSVLAEIGLPRDSLLWSLLNFNLGVEAGQLAAILITVPVLIYLRKTSWEPIVVRRLSQLVLVVGMVLFAERIVGAWI
ncbi:MAG: HupE/UreJ family protein [Burkholderiaceae bacterium]